MSLLPPEGLAFGSRRSNVGGTPTSALPGAKCCHAYQLKVVEFVINQAPIDAGLGVVAIEVCLKWDAISLLEVLTLPCWSIFSSALEAN